jgi:hypothetical protein
MAGTELDAPTIPLADAIQLYFNLLDETKGLEEQLRLLRGRILSTLAARKLDRVQADGVEVLRQVRHHPPRINIDMAEEILRQHGRLEECRVEMLDEEKARGVIDELFRHGSLSKDDLPYLYVKPTEALIVHEVREMEIEEPREVRRIRRAA